MKCRLSQSIKCISTFSCVWNLPVFFVKLAHVWFCVFLSYSALACSTWNEMKCIVLFSYVVWYAAHYYVIKWNQLISINIKKPFLVEIARHFIMWREETMKAFWFLSFGLNCCYALLWKSIIRIENPLQLPPPRCNQLHLWMRLSVCLSVSQFVYSFSFTIVHEIKPWTFDGLLQLELFIDFTFKYL